MPKPGSSHRNRILSYYIMKKECGQTNPKLCVSENAPVLDLCKITEPREKAVKS